MLGLLPCDLLLITIHISDCRQFCNIYIAQGSVAIYLRRGAIFKYDSFKFTTEFDSERILKIG